MLAGSGLLPRALMLERETLLHFQRERVSIFDRRERLDNH